jgi:hypothetical protein
MTTNNSKHKKPQTIYLHIGYNKTGTMAVQRIFFDNVEKLAKYGIFYPVKCRGKRKSQAHHSLVESLLHHLGKPLPKFVKTKIYSKFPKDHYWQLLHKELAETDCETIFISSEAFSRLRGSREMMEFVKNQFSGYQVKVLVYLRSQVEYFESAYNQVVKRNYETRTVDEMMKSGWLTMDYFAELEQWAEVFGAENLVVRIYDRNRFVGKNVVEDVLALLKIQVKGHRPDTKEWQVKTNYNIRMPNTMVETNRKINKNIRLPRFFCTAVVFWRWLTNRYSLDAELLTEEQKGHLKDFFSESNRKLGKKYLGGEFPFN